MEFLSRKKTAQSLNDFLFTSRKKHAKTFKAVCKSLGINIHSKQAKNFKVISRLEEKIKNAEREDKINHVSQLKELLCTFPQKIRVRLLKGKMNYSFMQEDRLCLLTGNTGIGKKFFLRQFFTQRKINSEWRSYEDVKNLDWQFLHVMKKKTIFVLNLFYETSGNLKKKLMTLKETLTSQQKKAIVVCDSDRDTGLQLCRDIQRICCYTLQVYPYYLKEIKEIVQKKYPTMFMMYPTLNNDGNLTKIFTFLDFEKRFRKRKRSNQQSGKTTFRKKFTKRNCLQNIFKGSKLIEDRAIYNDQISIDNILLNSPYHIDNLHDLMDIYDSSVQLCVPECHNREISVFSNYIVSKKISNTQRNTVKKKGEKICGNPNCLASVSLLTTKKGDKLYFKCFCCEDIGGFSRKLDLSIPNYVSKEVNVILKEPNLTSFAIRKLKSKIAVFHKLCNCSSTREEIVQWFSYFKKIYPNSEKSFQDVVNKKLNSNTDKLAFSSFVKYSNYGGLIYIC